MRRLLGSRFRECLLGLFEVRSLKRGTEVLSAVSSELHRRTVIEGV
jgi:hypothetical protein